MRLLSCHIENFGKLHQFDMEFHEGLNVICRDNGWGKSTLAAFIKAMLYGLDGDRKRGVTDNERRKFKPWQGGVFGGRLEWEEAGGKRYAASRTFGDTPARDTFELRDLRTNLVTDDYSSRLGEELFHLNSASYYRSIFISQSDCPTSSTDDIHAKIGNLADNTGDINSFEAAEKKLSDQINRLTPERSTGLLHRLHEEAAILQRKVREGSSLDETIAARENELADAMRQKQELIRRKGDWETMQKQAVRLQDLRVRRKEYEMRRDSTQALQAQLDDARRAFPGEMPEENTVREMLATCGEMKSAREIAASFALTEQESNHLDALRRLFGNHPPSTEEIDLHIREEQSLRRMTARLDRLQLTPGERGRLAELHSGFAGDSIAPSALSEKWEERCRQKNALSAKQDSCAEMTASRQRARRAAAKRAAILCAVGGLMLLAGGVLCAPPLHRTIPGAAAAAIGIPLLTAGIIAALRRARAGSRFARPIESLQAEIDRDARAIKATDDLTCQFLTRHGRAFDEPLVHYTLQEIGAEQRELERLKSRSEQADEFIRNNRPDALRESINGFLGQYGIASGGDDLSDTLYGLRGNALMYSSLSQKDANWQNARGDFVTKQKILSGFLASLGLEADDIQAQLEQIRSDMARYKELSQQYTAARAELDAFAAQNDLSALTADDTASLPALEELNGEINSCAAAIEALNDSMQAVRQEIEKLYSLYEQWENDKCLLQKNEELRSASQLKYSRLVLARKYLRTAKESLTARYVDTIYSAFGGYYQLLTGQNADHYRIDANVTLTVDELGHQRDEKTLSAGTRDMAGVCLRLALADAMYPDEKPALIMDDPFTNLDDAKIAAARQLLDAVAAKYQVIYFTCSASRE